MGIKYLLAASLLTACADVPAPTPSTDDVDVTFRGEVTERTITHVVAITAIDDAVTRVVAPVLGGSFSVNLAPQRPWLLVFVDDTQIGEAKTIGVLRAGTMDAMLAAAPGEVELGRIRFAAGSAFADIDDTLLHAALGLDDETAASIGAMDDFATRYANVDLDGDGVLDAYQAGFAGRLDIHADMRVTHAGRAPTIEDLMAGDLQMAYLGASITAHLPDAFGAVDPATASVTFDAPFYGIAQGRATPVTVAGTPITGSDLILGTGHNFGVYAATEHKLPDGRYRFEVGHDTLDFTSVRSSADPVLAPFVHLGMPASCARTCVPTSVDYSWKRHTEAGWVALTDAETAVLEPTSTVEIVQTGTMGVTYRSYTLPIGKAFGSVAWDDDGATLYTTAPTSQPAGDVQFMSVRYGFALGVRGDASFAISPFAAPVRPTRQ